jgi:hypothetical protein
VASKWPGFGPPSTRADDRRRLRHVSKNDHFVRQFSASGSFHRKRMRAGGETATIDLLLVQNGACSRGGARGYRGDDYAGVVVAGGRQFQGSSAYRSRILLPQAAAQARPCRGWPFRTASRSLGQYSRHWAAHRALACLILIGALGLDGLCAAMTVAVATARRSYSVWSTCQTCRGRAKRVIPDAVVFRTVQRLNSRSNLADQTSAAMTSPNSSQFLPLQR